MSSPTTDPPPRLTVPVVVGDLRWPVISALCLDPSSRPAQFVVIVDCGEGTPREQFATLRVEVWPDRTVATRGEYNLTLFEAHRSLLERAELLTLAADTLDAAGHKVIRATTLARLRRDRADADANLERLRTEAEDTDSFGEFDEADYDDGFAARDLLRELLA